MSVKLRYRTTKLGRSYYLDIHHAGKRFRETLNITSKNEKVKKDIADRIRIQRELELISTEHNVSIPKSETILDYARIYLSRYEKADINKVRATVQHLEHFFHETTRLKSVTPQVCIDFRDKLSRNLSRETTNSYFKVFTKILKHAVRSGYLAKSPAFEVRNVAVYRRLTKHVLSPDDLTKLVNTSCVGRDVKRAFLLSCNTGLGYKECKLLKWSMIQDKKILGLRPKTETEQTIDLNNNALRLLGERGVGQVFKLPSASFCRRALLEWVRDAGIDKHITWYCARHTFATNLLIFGADLKTVASLMGHTSTKHTERYLNYVDDLKRKAVDRLPDL